MCLFLSLWRIMSPLCYLPSKGIPSVRKGACLSLVCFGVLMALLSCHKAPIRPPAPPPPVADGLYMVHTKTIPTRCLDIRQSDVDPARVGRLQIWDCTPENSWQKFFMTYDASLDAYEMRIEREGPPNFSTQDCVDVYGMGGGNGNIIHRFQCNNQANQRFRVIDEGGGWYQLRPMHIDGIRKCMDIANGSTGNASEVHQWQCNSPITDNQLWHFESTAPTPFNPGSGPGGPGPWDPDFPRECVCIYGAGHEKSLGYFSSKIQCANECKSPKHDCGACVWDGDQFKP